MHKASLLESRRLLYLQLCVCVSLLCSCSWQRIPESPAYENPGPIPITVGVIIGNTPPSQLYGPMVISDLAEMAVFDSIVYAYRQDDPVDGVLEMTITGGWRGHGGAAGFLIGLSLFTLSPFIGPSMTGTHDATVILEKDMTQMAQYKVHVKTSVSWGLAANTNEVGAKCDKLQARKLAVEIAGRINDDKSRIMNSIAK